MTEKCGRWISVCPGEANGRSSSELCVLYAGHDGVCEPNRERYHIETVRYWVSHRPVEKEPWKHPMDPR